MKLIFLGSGSAFTVGANNFQSNMLIESDSKERLMIDCGTDARWSVHEAGFNYRDIDSVYISHLHADHTGGLEWLGFNRYFDPSCSKPTLYIPECYVAPIWDNILSGGLNSLDNEKASLSSFFRVTPIPNQGSFTWLNVTFQLVETSHIHSKFSHMSSFGLYFTVQGVKIFITTDTQFLWNKYRKYYEDADLIFHDCETAKFPTHVHSHYEELLTLDPSIRKKIWLYHYNPGLLPDAQKDGFSGFVTKGQIFDFSNPDSL